MQFTDSLIGTDATVRTQTSLLVNHILPYISPVKATSISEFEIAAIMKKHWKLLNPSSVKKVLQLLSRYLAFHGNNVNMSRLIKKAGSSSTKIKAISSQDLSKLLKELENEPYDFKLAITIAAYTGMRRGEIFSLKVEDIDLINNKIKIYKTKTGAPRVIPLHCNIVKLLLKGNYIFCAPNDPIFKSPFDPNRRLKLLCKKAGITPISIHGLRHTFATLGLNSGKSVRDIQSLLGHRSASTTMDIYWANIKDVNEIDFIPSEEKT